MFFKKKKKDVDLRDLHKKGLVIAPTKKTIVPTDSRGFVELNSRTLKETPTSYKRSDLSPTTSFSSEKDGYNKREVDTKISNLDNKIYKLENRVELLEKKLGVTNDTSTSTGLIGW